MPLVTLAQWKDYRQYPGTDYDTAVGVVIPFAKRDIEKYISSEIDERTYTAETIDGTGTDSVATRNWPITAISEIRIVSGITATVVESTAYAATLGAQSRGWITRRQMGFGGFGTTLASNWPSGTDNIEVDYTSGYSDGEGKIPYPPEMTEAALILIDHKLASRGYALDRISEAGGNVNVSLRTAADRMDRVHQLLGSFRRGCI